MNLKVNVQSVAELREKLEQIVSDEGGSDLAIQELDQMKENLDEAAELAEEAKTLANDAENSAGDACSNANDAASAADEAQSSAMDAASKAYEAKAGVEDAMARLDDIRNMLQPSKTAAYITSRITNMLVSEDDAPETEEQTAVPTKTADQLSEIAMSIKWSLDDIQKSSGDAIAAIQRLMEVITTNERG